MRSPDPRKPTSGAQIVVAGVSSFYMTLPVGGFPLAFQSQAEPAWLGHGVAGAGAHIAKVLDRLGDDVRLCTMVGCDAAGDAIRAGLREAGLLGPGVVNTPESSVGVVLAAADGRRMGHPYLSAVNAVRYPVEVFERLVDGADLAVLTTAPFVRPLLGHARRMDVPVAVDVHLITDIADVYARPWLEIADIVFCSHERLPCPLEEWVGQVFERYPGCAIVGVGRGARGCALGLRDGRLLHASAVTPRGVVNTAGAGDMLFASFLHAWLATGRPVDALQTAAVYAGWQIGSHFPAAEQLTESAAARLLHDHAPTVTIGRWDGE